MIARPARTDRRPRRGRPSPPPPTTVAAEAPAIADMRAPTPGTRHGGGRRRLPSPGRGPAGRRREDLRAARRDRAEGRRAAADGADAAPTRRRGPPGDRMRGGHAGRASHRSPTPIKRTYFSSTTGLRSLIVPPSPFPTAQNGDLHHRQYGRSTPLPLPADHSDRGFHADIFTGSAPTVFRCDARDAPRADLLGASSATGRAASSPKRP